MGYSRYCLNCAEFGQLILNKIIKIVATRSLCQILGFFSPHGIGVVSTSATFEVIDSTLSVSSSGIYAKNRNISDLFNHLD